MKSREVAPDDYRDILHLNEVEQRQTSPMDRDRLHALLGLDGYHRVVEVDGGVGGFLLAMHSSAQYRNENFDWFAARYQRFIYVDRIVVSRASARAGIGGTLYEELFEYARRTGIPRVTCEFNLEPPNPASAAFHARFGFREVGQQTVAGGAKRVSLQLAEA